LDFVRNLLTIAWSYRTALFLIRILVFYLGSTLTVGLLVPSSSPDLLGGTGDASSSPFVIAIKSAGITVLPDLINVVILVSAISAASSKLCQSIQFWFQQQLKN
jgi:amino acid permease